MFRLPIKFIFVTLELSTVQTGATSFLDKFLLTCFVARVHRMLNKLTIKVFPIIYTCQVFLGGRTHEQIFLFQKLACPENLKTRLLGKEKFTIFLPYARANNIYQRKIDHLSTGALVRCENYPMLRVSLENKNGNSNFSTHDIYVQKKNKYIFFKKGKISNLNFFGNTEFYIGIL